MTIPATDPRPQVPTLGAHLLDGRRTIVDLTRPIYEGMPMWFGHQETKIVVHQTHDEFKEKYGTRDGFHARDLLISEHAGTHTDATFEYDPDGKTLDAIPLTYYYGSAVCIDLSHVSFQSPDPDRKGYAGVADVQVAEEKLAKSGEEIRPGDIVLAWFDYGDRWFPEPKYIDENPGFDWEGAEYLAAKGVVNIGSDCNAIDNSLDNSFPGHMVCKKYGIVNTEHLANLGEVVNKRFEFFGLPLHILGGTGSPIRAIAVLD
ncbi:cyclase family protein [Mycolicibacterium komossense]|uniref:Cyclase family protein n=1 Tax=Mycolicibacterium komossense TaxID=1779 RepID=A0ABT3CIU3_9MYCO|nr:cyclase family protein [Mycolicibacterium komossense]MCV7229423.1 cyclase family protein [Mycolicibacterium komossense]